MRTPGQFITAAHDPDAWFRAGDRLLMAARDIWAQEFNWSGPGPNRRAVDYFSAFLLLAGFGLESNLKGLLVRQMRLKGIKVVKTTGPTVTIAKQLLTHDLLKLADRASIAPLLTVDHRGLLARLTVYTKWGGRYPVEVTWTGADAAPFLLGTDWRDVEAIKAHVTNVDGMLQRIERERLP